MEHTAEAQGRLHTAGLILHGAAIYDLQLWLLTFGRERALREKALRLAQLAPGDSVLDVGCGTGTLALVAKQQVGPTGSVFGVDASPTMIVRAEKKARRARLNIEFRNALVETLPFPDAHFDVVTSTLMLHHLPGKLRSRCAAEIRRVLKPKGRVLAIDFVTSPQKKKGLVAHLHRHGHISFSQMQTIFGEAGMQLAECGPLGISDLHYVLAVAP